jgi:phenylalanyl-tRNA synthetase beta chain
LWEIGTAEGRERGSIVENSEMKFLESWLRECFADGLTKLSGEQLCAQLTDLGLEVDSYENGVIDIQLTPNRGDCASILGIAREVALANQTHIQFPHRQGTVANVTLTGGGSIPITINSPQDCPLYITAKITDLNPAAQTPDDMIKKLVAAGNKAIHPVVDILNYVMLESGQPMHAFDAKGLEQGLIVERTLTPSNAGGGLQNSLPEEECPRGGVVDSLDRTTVELLNDQTIKVHPNTLVIRNASDQTILALAGIMGAKQNSVTAETRDIILEAAHFTPDAIRGRARNHGLQTDASYRFERGVDPTLPPIAMQRAIDLILEIAGGKLSIVSEYGTQAKGTPSNSPLTGGGLIVLRHARLTKILGIEIPKEKVNAILKGLQMQVSFDEAKQVWQVSPPSFRFDIAIEADLIEEVARIIGYNHLPSTLPVLPIRMLPQSKDDVFVIDLKKRLQASGYHEAISYSFTEPRLQTLLTPHLQSWTLSNPISPELSVMRTTLWASLMPILLHNQKRQQPRIRLFETGLRFIEAGKEIQQISTISGLAWGAALPEQWGSPKRALDFYDIKADVESMLSHLGEAVKYVAANHPALHPGRSAGIELNGVKIGYVGAFHPEIEQTLSLPGLYGFELDLTVLTQKEKSILKPVSKFPLVRRDLALLVDRSVQAAQLKTTIIKVAGQLLYEVNLFDIYQGKGIPENKKSIAFSVTLQAPDRTLLETEVTPLMEQVVKALEQQFAAILREG